MATPTAAATPPYVDPWASVAFNLARGSPSRDVPVRAPMHGGDVGGGNPVATNSLPMVGAAAHLRDESRARSSHPRDSRSRSARRRRSLAASRGSDIEDDSGRIMVAPVATEFASSSEKRLFEFGRKRRAKPDLIQQCVLGRLTALLETLGPSGRRWRWIARTRTPLLSVRKTGDQIQLRRAKQRR
jgi:hypothetical protein